MDKEIEIDENIELSENNEQSNFLQSTLGKVIDFSLDTGLRAILPDIIEDEVIDIKDTLVNEGFSEAIDKVVNTAIDFGKSAIGIVTGNFESVSQAEKAVEKGGIIDGVSSALDFVLDKVNDLGFISDDITNISDGRTLDFVCVFRAVFSRVFMGGKICALYFKICLT